jgi:hypothetical protein
MSWKKLNKNDINIRITAYPEDIPVKGNAICSGNEDFDQQVESEILERLEQDEVWAWATVCVTAEWEGLKEEGYLGCCCYADEKEFCQEGGYYEEMVEEAINNLNKRMQNLYKKMSVLMAD